MHSRLQLALGCAAALAIAGCGSGSSKPSGTEERRTAAPPAHTGAAPPASSLQRSTTPNYAPPPAGAPKSGTVDIAYREIAIDPDTVKVKVGTTVRWTNYDPVEHNVTSESGPAHFSSGNFSEGHTFEVKLTRPGTLHYQCTLHPATMNGTIQVVN